MSHQDAQRIVLAAIDALPVPVAILDDRFVVEGANLAWRRAAIGDLRKAIESEGLPKDERDTIRARFADLLSGERDECRLTFPSDILLPDQQAVIVARRIEGVGRTVLASLQIGNAAGSPSEPPGEADRALFETDLEGNVVSWSLGARELFERNEDEVLLHPISVLSAKSRFRFPTSSELRDLRKGRVQTIDLRMKRGSTGFFDGRIEARFRTDGDGTRLLCEASVVSKRQRAGSLRRREERLRYALEAASDGIWDWDIETNRVVFTARVTEILGGGTGRGIRSTLIESWNERIHPDDEAGHRRALAAHFESRTPAFESEYRLLTNDGEWKWVLVRGRITEWGPSGKPMRMLGTITDISERKFAEEALQRSEQQYRNLFEHASDAVVLFDMESSAILDANQKAADIFGYPAAQLKRMTIRELHPGDHWSRLETVLKRADARTGALFEVDGLTRDGERVPLETSICRVTYAGRTVYQSFIRDISERRMLEGQLRQSQKMETVGRLAGGIAHDFNNILTAIQGYATLLSAALTGATKEREMAEEVTRAVQRASRLTMQLLTFSRRHMTNPTTLDLNRIVEEMQKMLRQLIGEHVEVVVNLSSRPGLIYGDEGGMEQVITNLVVNAADAMPDGGTLNITTDNVHVEAGTSGLGRDAASGDYVLLSVSDQGAGIDPDVLPQIFEPFFTTKGPGTGTGLGLATVYGIVKRSQGHVAVDSEVGKGTCFRIYLPASVHREEAEPPRPETPKSSSGRETVLLVEDESAVRRLARRFLETSGYTVVEAQDATAAIAAADAHTGMIDLLLTDVIMPRISGPELAKRLRERQPDLKVLYMSGHPGEFIARHGVSGAERGYLQKPFSQEALTLKTREVLDS